MLDKILAINDELNSFLSIAIANTMASSAAAEIQWKAFGARIQKSPGSNQKS